MASKPPLKLKNLLSKGQKRFGGSNSDDFDFLNAREQLVNNRKFDHTDDNVYGTSQSTSNGNAHPDAPDSSELNDHATPSENTHKIEMDKPRSSGPVEPGLNLVQEKFMNQVQDLALNDKFSNNSNAICATDNSSSQEPPSSKNMVHEPSSNKVHEPGSSINSLPTDKLILTSQFDLEINSTTIPTSSGKINSNKVHEPGSNCVHKQGSANGQKLTDMPEQLLQIWHHPAPGNQVQTKDMNRVHSRYSVHNDPTASDITHSPKYEPSSNPVQYRVQSSSMNPVQNHVHPDQDISTLQRNFELERLLTSLGGNNHKLFDYIAHIQSKSGVSHVETTYPFLCHVLGIPMESMKTSFKRLSKKGLIVNNSHSTGGRGSKRNIGIPKDILTTYISILLHRQKPNEFLNPVQNQVHFDTRTRSEPGSPLGSFSSSSSSDINNKNITNTIGPESKRQDLPEDWLQIQTPENVKAIGFGQTQIKQLFQLGTLSASEVQESLEAFAYDLEVGGISSRGSKLAFLMGILRRSGAYISEGLVNELKVQVENNEKRRREMADLERRQAQDKLTAKAQEIASHMTEREKLSLVPENGLVKIGSVSHERLVMAKIVEGLSKS